MRHYLTVLAISAGVLYLARPRGPLAGVVASFLPKA